MEHLFVKIASFIFSRFSFPGFYRIVSFLYSYSRGSFQKGIWIEKNYLSPEYDLKILLFSKDLIDHKILFSGVYEKETNWVLENHINEGDVVVEAGANSGTETLLISRLVGRNGIVHAFEPLGSVAAKLRKNVELNALSNVKFIPEALGETIKVISFFVLPETHPNQDMGSKVISNAAGSEIKVQQVTLDSLKLSRLDFLKMDVQGAELDILKGGIDTIATFKPKIFLEAGEGWSNIQELIHILDDLGYNAHYVSAKLKLVPINSTNLRSGNWLAVPKIKNETNHPKP